MHSDDVAAKMNAEAGAQRQIASAVNNDYQPDFRAAFMRKSDEAEYYRSEKNRLCDRSADLQARLNEKCRELSKEREKRVGIEKHARALEELVAKQGAELQTFRDAFGANFPPEPKKARKR